MLSEYQNFYIALKVKKCVIACIPWTEPTDEADEKAPVGVNPTVVSGCSS